MEDHKVAHFFVIGSAYLGLGVAAFILMVGVAVAGVSTSNFVSTTVASQTAAVAFAQVVPPPDYAPTSPPPNNAFVPAESMPASSSDSALLGAVAETGGMLGAAWQGYVEFTFGWMVR